MEKLNKLIEGKVSEEIVNYFIDFLDNYSNDDFIDTSNVCTLNGNQTPNVLSQIDPNIVAQIKTNYLLPSINIIKGWYKLEDIEIDSIHLIEYLNQGKQTIHNHENWEDYSWIIYLNDSDGDTIFYTFPKHIQISPKKGKIVIWKSYIDHEGLESLKNKKVVVGSIKEIGKKWIQ